MDKTTVPPSWWPVSIYDPETDTVRVVSRQRAVQLLHPEKEKERYTRANRSEAHRRNSREWYYRNKAGRQSADGEGSDG